MVGPRCLWKSGGSLGALGLPPPLPPLKNSPERIRNFSQPECERTGRGPGDREEARSGGSSSGPTMTLVGPRTVQQPLPVLHEDRDHAPDRMALEARLLQGPRRHPGASGGRCLQPSGPDQARRHRAQRILRDFPCAYSDAAPGRARPRRAVSPSCPATGRQGATRVGPAHTPLAGPCGVFRPGERPGFPEAQFLEPYRVSRHLRRHDRTAAKRGPAPRR